MLSIEDIVEKSEINLHTFRSWRKNDLKLLPNPIAVEKRKIFFPDSILERIKFIRKQQAAGKSLAEIEEMILAEQAKAADNLPTWESLQSDHELFTKEAQALNEKWEKGECLDEVCAALKLDPALSGKPGTFCLPAVGKLAGTLAVYVGIVSNNTVHFAELEVDLSGHVDVRQAAEIPAADYGMMLYIIGREFVEHRKLLKTEMIPYLLFHGLEGTEADGGYWMQSIKVAGILNQVTEAGRQYLVRLKSGDIKIP
ncbi:hypothetical protein C4J81_04275 [Deltaproteobacteria bacterium Smac51]|nr:hypothetical protein C4J81_04275 [Deltaproteobacteria bacterium Smac51]